MESSSSWAETIQLNIHRRPGQTESTGQDPHPTLPYLQAPPPSAVPSMSYLPRLQTCCHVMQEPSPTLRLCLWGRQGCPTLVHVPRNSGFLPLQPCPGCHSVSAPPQTPMPPQHPIVTQSLTSLHSPVECLALFLHSQEGGPQSWMKCYPVCMLP